MARISSTLAIYLGGPNISTLAIYLGGPNMTNLRISTAAAITAVFLLLNGFLSVPGNAQDVPINAFYGKWIGSGVSQSESSIAFRYSHRDLNVTVTPAGSGFAISWTTIQRKKGDPNNPTPVKKTSSTTYVPAGRANVWRATRSLDPIGGRVYSWARLKDQTLTVNSFQILPDGSYEMQVYDRVLSGLGMKLTFSRIVNGKLIRTVKGQLTKFSE
jgi:hypothetical protein